MSPLTAALHRAIEEHLMFRDGREPEPPRLAPIADTDVLRDSFQGASEAALFTELLPDRMTTRALWFELFEAGAKPPLTAITPGPSGGVTVVLDRGRISLFIAEDEGVGQLQASLVGRGDSAPTWTFERV